MVGRGTDTGWSDVRRTLDRRQPDVGQVPNNTSYHRRKYERQRTDIAQQATAGLRHPSRALKGRSLAPIKLTDVGRRASFLAPRVARGAEEAAERDAGWPGDVPKIALVRRGMNGPGELCAADDCVRDWLR